MQLRVQQFFTVHPNQKVVHTIALTINNTCNLKCPHCYLQYDGPRELLSDVLQDRLFSAKFQHLAIVGKEPLVNDQSIRLCESLIDRCQLRGTTVSMITNGVNIDKLDKSTAKKLAWLDVSFDGGPRTYGVYRRASYSHLISGLQSLLADGQKHINALHVINDSTLPHLGDMLDISFDFPFETIMFSPFLETRSNGRTYVDAVSLSRTLDSFAHSPQFLRMTNAILLFDVFHLEANSIDESQCRKMINDLDLSTKVRLIGEDPLRYGILRLTYDSLLLSPAASLHTADYDSAGIPVTGSIDIAAERAMSLVA